MRMGLWVGLFIAVCAVLFWHLFLPAGGFAGLLLAGALLAVGLTAFGSYVIRVRGTFRPIGLTRADRALLVALVVLLVLCAFWAAGEPTNYDTGLYHLGAISYASDYRVIPGLANLHDRFGFNSSMWPLAALLGTGPWTGNGFRLVNGLLVTVVCVDLALRMTQPGRARRSAGTYLLIITWVLAVGAIAQYPGRLIASSAQDTAALLLVMASMAYLLDFLSLGRARPQLWSPGIVAALIAVVAGTIRPLGWAFALGVGAVLVVAAVRRWGWASAIARLWPLAIAALAALALVLITDIFLSGWLLFPLSALPMPVDWRALDPLSAARDITGWARTPFQDVDVTLADNSWVGGWLLRLPTDWSIPASSALIATLAGLLVAAPARAAIKHSWRVIVLALVPPIIALALWFVNAPDPRFAWGYMLTMAAVPLAVVLAALHRWRVFAACAVAGLAALLVLAGLRGSLGALAWGLRAPPTPAVAVAGLADGTLVSIPVDADKCWQVYPLCAPSYTDRGIVRRGDALGDGFAPLSAR